MREGRKQAEPLPPEETESLTALLERLRPRLRKILKWHRIPPEEAEDLVHDTLVAALQEWPRIEFKEPWIASVLHRKCIGFHRRQRARHERVMAVDPESLDKIEAGEPPPQAASEQAMDVRALLSRLPRRSRRALWLRYGLGLSPEEVAQRLGWHSGESCRQSLHRGLRCLRRAAGG
jgi:RNA polymerase sigma factor (sigma-70 family)